MAGSRAIRPGTIKQTDCSRLGAQAWINVAMIVVVARQGHVMVGPCCRMEINQGSIKGDGI